MYSPFQASYKADKKIISYTGNKRYKKIEDVLTSQHIPLDRTLNELITDDTFHHIQKIDSTIFNATIKYFQSIEAEWFNLPLTTRMISSPGEVYAGDTLNYTTDTLPIELKWFNNNKKIFLSESSQFYLELGLLLKNTDKLFSIYSSFRKESSDFSHLSEFQHIEFEGHVDYQKNIEIFKELIKYITKEIIKNNYSDLYYFLTEDEIKYLANAFNENNLELISFRDALNILYDKTGDKTYKEFTLEHFGSWEEIYLTNTINKNVILTEFPLLQIPFYHNGIKKEIDGVPVAQNADLILLGYREVIGSGARINDEKDLQKKAQIFNLPLEDYDPYIKSRKMNLYKPTPGFGMGWQRYTHWLLKLPYITNVALFPRTHNIPKI